MNSSPFSSSPFGGLRAGETRRYAMTSRYFDEFWAFRVDPDHLADGAASDVVINAIAFVDVSMLGGIDALRQAVPALTKVLRARYGLSIDKRRFEDATQLPVLAVIGLDELRTRYPGSITDVVADVEAQTGLARMNEGLDSGLLYEQLAAVL